MDDKSNNRIASLSEYALLGRSGLRVSPLCLGTMTFGTDWGWGAPADTARSILERYLEAGGNFIDTADGYTNGASESILGEWFADTKRRDEVVLATKFSFNTRPGDPNAGGNGRKHIQSALEGSLRRLKTDYVDLYWLHAWDGFTPVDEVMSTMDALVRSGKIRYFGLSDVPAWYFARAQTLAEERGTEPVIALQLEYSLVERNIEHEHVPVALELGAGILPWSPLASGLLSGKYKREGVYAKGGGRLEALRNLGNPAFDKLFTEKNWRIVDTLIGVAREMGRAPAEIALAWVARRPGVSSTIIGATKMEQLESNLRSLDIEIPAELSTKLEEAGRPELVFPYLFSSPPMRAMLTGGTTVRAEPPWYRPNA
jgi:aryl-alcohol dehydrogenase-like predicted oxidoreductase